MKKIIFNLIVLGAVLFADDSPFSAKAELGYIQTSGNSDSESLNFDAKAKKKWQRHSLELEADAQLAKNNDEESTNRFTSEIDYGYEYSKVLTYGYIAGYKRDKFSGYDYQLFSGPMMEYKAISTPKTNFDLEFALLYAKDKLETKDSDSYVAYRFRGIYTHKIIETLKFEEDFSFRGSFEDANNYFIVSKTSLINKITDIISAGVTYRVDHANIVPLDRVKTDRTFMINLIFDYN